MNVKERIQERFDVEYKYGCLRFINKKSGRTHYIPPNDVKSLIALSDIPEKEQKDVERLIQEGKAVRLNNWDIYKMFGEITNLTESELIVLFYGYDERTARYLKAVLNNIGLIDHKYGWDEENFKVIRQYKIYEDLTGSGYVDVGKLVENKYIAQFSYRTDIDDYCVERLYFSRFPTEKDVRKAILVDEIKFFFKMHPGTYEFTCWECGIKKHWLDIDAKDLSERFEMLKEQYCGC